MAKLDRVLDYTVYLPFGIGTWLSLCAAKGPYRGTRAFYRMALSGADTPSAKIARGLLELGFLRMLFTDYDFYKKNLNNPGPAPVGYVDDSLEGYGDPDYVVGGADDIAGQQRGLMLPMVRRCLDRLPAGSVVAEIGAGNGDVTALLAREYPRLRFDGIDLFVGNAQRKHSLPNLRFIGGYPLDEIRRSGYKADAVFASSTFVLFTPLELNRYVAAMVNAGVKHVLLSDPCFGGYVHEDTDDTTSKHMEGPMWFHNYCGHLRSVGYRTRELEFFPYKNPRSARPDLHVGLVWAERP